MNGHGRGRRIARPLLSLALVLALSGLGALASGDDGTGDPPPDPRRRLRRILKRPMYQRWKRRQARSVKRDETNPLASLRDSVLDYFERWMKRRSRRQDAPAASSHLGGGAGLADVLRTVAWIVLAAVVVVAAVLLTRWVLQARASAVTTTLSRRQVREALEKGDALSLDGEGWMREAERLAAEGDLRAVFRALYLALLSGLHSAGRIDYRRNRTNWAYVRHYRGEDAEREGFATLTGAFDHVWYGLRVPTETAVRDARRRVGVLLEGGRP